MDSDTTPLRAQLKDRRQYKIPFYQRTYVWTKDEQWEPLWEDIIRKANTRMSGDTPAAHFLGAIVLEKQENRGLKGVETFHVIDGQQRLTTIQYFLASILISMRYHGADSIAPVVEECVWNANTSTMLDPDVEVYKVWPTFLDRPNFIAAMTADSIETLRSRFPEHFAQQGHLKKIGVRHPAALHAIYFFYQKISEWLADQDTDHMSALEALALAALDDLHVVWITLGRNDDAQVIFETLNGRGAQLQSTDLIRNFIFLRADREGADARRLYEEFWQPFEAQFWVERQSRGRMNRPRLEWFVQTALQAETMDEVELGRLYSEYREFFGNQERTVSAEGQLEFLNRYAEKYRALVLRYSTYPIGQFGNRVAVWDASATYPLALKISESELAPEEHEEMFNDIISYLVRRAVCGLTTKNYNKVFLQILRRMMSSETCTPEGLRAALTSMNPRNSLSA
jgi:hypothetical protein